MKRIELDEYPVKLDGFRYTDDTFLKCWRERKGFHQPDNVDYNAIFKQFDIFTLVESGEIDEVWCFTFPYSGFWETTMAGVGAFYCNSDPVPDTFKDGVQAVVDGTLNEQGVFVGQKIQAKCASKYEPDYGPDAAKPTGNSA